MNWSITNILLPHQELNTKGQNNKRNQMQNVAVEKAVQLLLLALDIKPLYC
jgi:hypothetical protein